MVSTTKSPSEPRGKASIFGCASERECSGWTQLFLADTQRGGTATQLSSVFYNTETQRSSAATQSTTKDMKSTKKSLGWFGQTFTPFVTFVVGNLRVNARFFNIAVLRRERILLFLIDFLVLPYKGHQGRVTFRRRAGIPK